MIERDSFIGCLTSRYKTEQSIEIHEIVNKLQSIPILIPLYISDGLEIEFIEQLQNTLMSFIEPFEHGVVDQREERVYKSTVFLSQCLIDASLSSEVLSAQQGYLALLSKQNGDLYEEKLQEQHFLVYTKFKEALSVITEERKIATLAKGA